jgi:hypothetical protein
MTMETLQYQVASHQAEASACRQIQADTQTVYMLCSWQQRAEQEQYSRKSAAERRMEEAAAWEAEKAEAKQAKVGNQTRD